MNSEVVEQIVDNSNPIGGILPDVMHIQQLDGLHVVFLLGLLIFFGSFGGRLFQKLKIPQVVGYIVIGIIIGASGFKILGDNLIKALDPISTVALTLIGFLVGAELKIDIIKKYGKQFIGILFGETLVPFVVVSIFVTAICYLFIGNFFWAVSLGLLLGAICTATAPAATTDVLKEYRTKGPLTTTVLGIVAMDDAFALVLFTIASAIASPLLEGKSVPVISQLGSIAYEIFGSIIVGLAFGALLNQIIKGMMNDDGRVLGFSLGALFLSTGVCELFTINAGPVVLKLDNIMAAMSVGFYIANFSLPKVKNMFKLVEKYTPPIYVLFFVTVGAKLNIWKLKPLLLLIAVLYVLGRTVGKTIGSRLGARLTKAPETVRKFLPFCLLSQAGVAIGLSTAAGKNFTEINEYFGTSIGTVIMLTITATTFIVQILGPICVKYGVSKAGEVGLDVTAEDIMKNARVEDVCSNGNKVCAADSYTIVNDTDMIGKIIANFAHHENSNYEVRSSDGKCRLVGQITLEHFKEAMSIGEMGEYMLAMDIMEKPKVTCTPQTSLPDAYQLFADYDTEAISIVDEQGKPMGILEKFTVDHFLHRKLVELEHKLTQMSE